MLPIPSTSKAGQWRVDGKSATGSTMKMGFSVNVPTSETQVVALKEHDLDGLLGGKDNYKIAVNAENLRDIVGTSRQGSELVPGRMFLILALVTAENLLANKFHKTTPKA